MDIAQYFKPGQPRRRLMMTFLGVLTCALSVGMFKQAGFGTDPFQCLCNGLDRVIPIDFGTLYMLINLALLAVVFFMDRHYIGIATFINLFLMGYIIDFSEHTLMRLIPHPSMAVRVVYIIVAIVVMCVGSSLYFTANLGVSTYDSIALHLADIKIAPFRFIRITTDLICVALGFAMGYVPGVGTIITALFMGPLISYFNRTIAFSGSQTSTCHRLDRRQVLVCAVYRYVFLPDLIMS